MTYIVTYQIYPVEFLFNKTNSSDTEAPFLGFDSNDTVSTKMYDKRDDFYFDIFPVP